MSQQSDTKVAGISENNTDANHFLKSITAGEQVLASVALILRWLCFGG